MEIVLGLALGLNGGDFSAWCRKDANGNFEPGCTVLGTGSGGFRLVVKADEDPDMEGHEGVPPNSRSSGTR